VNEAASTLSSRRARLRGARLYFVCDARPHGHEPGPLLEAALRGGVDILQLRQKELGDEALVEAAVPFREAARDHGALFILNDRPDLVEHCGADGVHVGQDDTPVAEARRIAGPDAVVGLSTHTDEQVAAAFGAEGDERPDQVSVGPVWETPTKPGRAAAGLDLVRSAAQRDKKLPWFAIGGIDRSNIGDVIAAGAERIVVVRAIRDAADPEAAARDLRAALARTEKAKQAWEELTRNAYAAIGRGDLDGLLAVVHPEVEFRSLVAEAEGQTYHGHAGVREWWDRVAKAFGALRFDIEELHALGDRGYAKVLVTATVSGVEVPQRMWQAARIRDGRAGWWDFYRTEAEAREAVGLPPNDA
jgi:thiamine-phosphate pyrophosphorylase